MEFKDKAKHVRITLIMSQTDFARELEVSFTAVNRWENGKAKPNYSAQRKFMEISEKHGMKFEEQETRTASIKQVL